MAAKYQHTIKEKRESRNKLVKQSRDIIDRGESEKRALSDEEKAQVERLLREAEALREECERLMRVDEADDEEEEDERDDEEEEDERDDEEGDRSKWNKQKGSKRHKPRTAPGGGGKPVEGRSPFESETEYRDRVRRSSPEYRKAFWRWMETGKAGRAIQADSDIVGGYTVMPQEFKSTLIKFVDNLLWIRKVATVHTLKAAQSMGAPSLDVDVSDADWTSELDTGNEDNAMAFGKRELTPRPLAKRLKVSNKLLRLASVTAGASADGSVATGGAENVVRSRLGYKFAVTEEKGFLTGTGANQPLGVFTASSRGISTARDFLTGAATGFTADGLLGAKYSMKAQYWPSLRWLFHRDALLKIAQLKDNNGQYLWVPNGYNSPLTFSTGADSRNSAQYADSLLGFPVMSSEYAPNTFTTGLYVGLLGAWEFYWIADAETLEIQRLSELYAASNQVGFIARMELDGMPVLEEAFTRLKTN